MLMSVGSRGFTVRHLIMGLVRVAKSEQVAICPPARERLSWNTPTAAYLEFQQLASEFFPPDSDGVAVMNGAAIQQSVDCEGLDLDFDDLLRKDGAVVRGDSTVTQLYTIR